MDKVIKRESCKYRHNGWPMCTVCDGRIHEPSCTSKRNKHKDCCQARHELLYQQGQTVGLYDAGQPMLPW